MRVSGFEDVLFFTQFSIKKSCYEHSVCIFSGNIASEDENKFLDRTGKNIQVFWEEPDKLVCVFSGRVESVQTSASMLSSTIEVIAKSLSADEDESAYTRIWQNPDKKIGEVLSKTQLEMIHCDLRLSELLHSTIYPMPILQNQESNFAFLQRVARYIGIPMWVEDTKKDKGIIVLSETLSDSIQNIYETDILRHSIIKEKFGMKSVNLTLKKYLPFGSKVRIPRDSREYVIDSLNVELQHESYEFHYRLKSYIPWKYDAKPVKHLEKTVYLTGIVEQNRDPKNLGRIQVAFRENDIQDKDESKMWIPYHSPYTGLFGGIVFMPDVGDMVSVVFSNESMYAIATLRKNALSDECQNVEEKYIGNNTKRRIFFREKELKFASGEHTVLMDDAKIVLSVGKSQITLTKDELSLKQDKTELILNNRGFHIKAKDNEIALEDQGIIGKSKSGIELTTQGSVGIVGNDKINIDARRSPLFLNGSVVNLG